MLYRDFGKTGWQVSAIGMGTWNIGNQWGELDDVTAWATVRSAYEHGINLFDTAESYGIPNGLSEERLGTAGQGVPKTTVDMIRLCCHASLGRLQTAWLDVVLCHEGNIEDPSVYLEAFEMLKRRGRIRAYGISTNDLDVLKRFNANDTCAVVEVNYSLINRAPEAALLPYCQEHNIAVLVRGPLRKGLLAGKYTRDSVFTDTVRSRWNAGETGRDGFEKDIAQVEKLKQVLQPGNEMVTAALRYVISHPAMPVAIPGAKSPEQAAMNAAAGAQALSTDEIDELAGLLD
jgi:aryl-alcohol dehydrogenase-like predicted oxidoreductase